jgi:hypothetical protein
MIVPGGLGVERLGLPRLVIAEVPAAPIGHPCWLRVDSGESHLYDATCEATALLAESKRTLRVPVGVPIAAGWKPYYVRNELTRKISRGETDKATFLGGCANGRTTRKWYRDIWHTESQ